MIAVGDKVPNVPLQLVTADGTSDVQSGEYLGTGRVVLFGVPAAFSPTCSDSHLPGFVAKADELSAKGVDKIVCVSVNDPFVMTAWAKDQAAESIPMLADGAAVFSTAMGLTFDGSAFGLGIRSQRYAAVLEDGAVTSIEVEAAPPDHEVSSAEHVLGRL